MGDLKGVWFRTLVTTPPSDVSLTKTNIMIDKEGNARLADFGLLPIVSDSTYPITTTSSEGAWTIRWMSPKLLDTERFCSKNSSPTKESDCYALGMVILEVLTGKIPFPGCNNVVAGEDRRGRTAGGAARAGSGVVHG